jgi:phosphoribosylamine--glycine ligase
MGTEQDELRKKGYNVFGGSQLGEKIENNRQYGQKIFSVTGMKIAQSCDFYDIDKMISFVRENKARWVVKQNDHAEKTLNYVGKASDSKDVVCLLNNYKKILDQTSVHFDLQENIDGIEIALGRYFNGKDWVGPTCINIEHKGLFNGNLGPKGEEMGSLVWYEKKETKLFKETVGKMKSFLVKSNYRGYFDINCIVNKNIAYPLESTSRMAYPTTQAQASLLISPWGEFLKAIASGEKYNLKYLNKYAVLVFVGAPPYPYKGDFKTESCSGVTIMFDEKISQEEMGNIYFEDVSIVDLDKKNNHVIAGNSGYILHAVGLGKTIEEARDEVYKLVNKIYIPKMFYRTDIGLKFAKEDYKRLKKWGWI